VQSDDDFRVFSRHAEYAGNPKPEHRARATQRNGGGHAGDVAHADGESESRGHGLKRAHIARARAALGDFAEDLAQRETETAKLHRTGDDGQQKARAHEQHNHGPAPNVTVDGAVPLRQGFTHAGAGLEKAARPNSSSGSGGSRTSRQAPRAVNQSTSFRPARYPSY
jgi:hypothetical protein